MFAIAPDVEVGDPRDSILYAGMGEGAPCRVLQWSPAAWLSYLSNGVMAFTVGEWQSWFCQFLGVPLASMLELSANNRKCACQRTYDADGDHILTCCRHLATRIRGHNHIQDCPVS